MESTVSVSKGVFVFQNGYKKQSQSKKKAKSLFEKVFTKEPWYITYKRNWDYIESEIQNLSNRAYSMLLNDVVHYILCSHQGENETVASNGIVPSATLLTGVNQPDHVSQFRALIEQIRAEVTPHIAMVHSQDAATLKHLVENVVRQLIHGNEAVEDASENEDEIGSSTKKIKKSHCSMKTLQKWYSSVYNTSYSSPKKKIHRISKKLVIIIPDFESFNCSVLQDFVMIVSSYVSTLPVVLVFGVATSVSALHKSFPYHVSSKLLIKVFHSHSSPVYMNQVLEDIFLTPKSILHFSGKAFQLLTDVFLFYDFSVTGLLQSIKYCMMDHYYGHNSKSLCCEREKMEEVLINLTAEDLENIRQLPSFRQLVEAQSYETQINLFDDDVIFKEVLYEHMNGLHDYLQSFYTCVRLLTLFVKDLPKNVLGKSVREVYAKCTVDCITQTQDFKECMQLLEFQSQVKLVETIKSALKVINEILKITSPVKPFQITLTKNYNDYIRLGTDLGESFIKAVRIHLLVFLRQIENADTESSISANLDDESDVKLTPSNRYKLKEKLLQATRVDKIQSEFEMIRSRFVSYLEEMFTKGLQPPGMQAFNEILFFSDVIGVKKHIVGAPRGALHMALSNPVHYLRCSCCHLPTTESMVDTLPDVCLAYKLHRECGKHINLYDWLQAFAAVLKPDEDDEQRHQDPNIQSRFTRAVAELQFLGFIKASKRKTDHVMRLTW